MRLLHITRDGDFTLEEFDTRRDEIPSYAVLSHTWEDEDVVYSDLKSLDRKQNIHAIKGTGWDKIRFCAKQTENDGPNYFWVESCCVDCASSSELNEAIDATYKRLKNAQTCYVLLLDVRTRSLEGDGELEFKNSTWFTQCWTMLDLAAPPFIEFFSRHGTRLGDKISLMNVIQEAMGLSDKALSVIDPSLSNELSSSDVALKVVRHRKTICKGNSIYCLLGEHGCSRYTEFGKEKEHALKQVQNAIQDKERRSKIYRWLAAPDPSTDYPKAHKQRELGTRIWFLDSVKFEEWRDSVGPSRLWIQGIPGSGRKILTSSVIENLQQQCHGNTSMVTIYFYFDMTDDQKRDARPMLRALLHQLLQHITPIPDDIEVSFKSSQAELENPQSIFVLLELMKHVTPYFTQIYIVLDAVDECVKRREALLLALQRMMDRQSDNIHLLVTSWDYPEPMKLFERSFVEREVVSTKELSLDVRRLRDDERLVRWKDDIALIQEIQVSLAYAAEGRIHEVESQLTTLGMCLTPAELRESLATLMKRTDDQYDLALCESAQRNPQCLRRILKWLVSSAQPLRSKFLKEVMALDAAEHPDFDSTTFEKASIVASLRQLGSGQGDSTHVPVHSLFRNQRFFRQYLFSERIKLGPAYQYSLQEEDCHKTIAKDCLKYLLQLQQSLSDHVQISPLATYAAKHWAVHFEKAGDDKEDLIPLVMRILSADNPAFPTWISLFDSGPPFEGPELNRGLVNEPKPLYFAAKLGLRAITTILLQKGADVNAQGGSYGSALQAAICRDHLDIVKILLDNGADVNAQVGSNSSNALQAAAYWGRLEIMKILIENGADVNAWGVLHGSALQIAASKGYLDVVKTLLNNGAEVNAWSEDHGSALQRAASGGHSKVVETLLNNGADVSGQEGPFGSAIDAATEFGHSSVVDLILEFSKSTAGSNIAPSDSGYASQRQANSLMSPSVADTEVQRDYFTETQSMPQASSCCDEEMYSDDFQSIQSDNESIGSKKSTTKLRAELFAINHLTTFFAQLGDLHPLHEMALHKIRRRRFIPNYRRILKLYYKSLLKEAASETEKAVTRVLRFRQNRVSIAEGIADQLEFDEEDEQPSLEKVLAQPAEKQFLENWLIRIQGSDYEKPVQPHQEPLLDDFRSKDNGSDSGVDTESETDAEDEYTNIEGAEKFLKQGSAFRNLVLNIRLLILPRHLRQVVETTPKISLQLIERSDTNCVNKVKAYLESYTGYRWDWWPLTPRIPNLGNGEHHLQWKLNKRILYTKITQEQVENLRCVLDLAAEHPPNCHCCVARPSTEWLIVLKSFFECILKFLQIVRQRRPMPGNASSKAAMAYIPTPINASGAAAAHSLSGTNTSGVTPNNSSSNLAGNNLQAQRLAPTIPASNPPKGPTRVIFGVQGMRRSLEIEQIEICNQMNDQRFFRELKSRYKKHRWSLQRFLSPFRFQYCNFVKFEKLNINRVFSFGQGLPEPAGFADDYDYDPKPPRGKIPLIEPGLFAVCLQSCEDDCKWSLLAHGCTIAFNSRLSATKLPAYPRKRPNSPYIATKPSEILHGASKLNTHSLFGCFACTTSFRYCRVLASGSIG